MESTKATSAGSVIVCFHGDARVGRRVWDKEAENGGGRSGSVNPVVGEQEETLAEGLTSSQGNS